VTPTRRWLAFTLLLALAGALHHAGLATLVGWMPRPFGEALVPLLLALLALGYALVLAVRPSLRGLALLAVALVVGLAASPWFTLLGVPWVLVYRRLLWSGRPWLALAFPILTLALVIAAADAAHFPAFVAAHPFTFELACLYAGSWFLRTLVVWQEARQGAPRPGRIELLVYFLFAPFVLVPPYMLALPPLALVTGAIDRPDPAVERSGLRWIVYGLALQVALAELGRLGLDPVRLIEPALRARDWPRVVPLAVAWYPVRSVLDAVGRGAFLVGIVRAFGVPLGPAFRAPLLARGLADWWRRYNTQFRDLLVSLFWYPVALRMRRRPILAGYAGCAAVFLAGNLPLHWPKQAALLGTPFSFPWGVAGECLLMTLLVGTSLAFERRAARGKVKDEPHGLARATAHRLVTWVVVCGAVVGVDLQIDYRLGLAPLERLTARVEALEAGAWKRPEQTAAEARALLGGLADAVAERPRQFAPRAVYARALLLSGNGPAAREQLALARAFDPNHDVKKGTHP
jgi:hypothetical protein